jgi:hypothetical protein
MLRMDMPRQQRSLFSGALLMLALFGVLLALLQMQREQGVSEPVVQVSIQPE